MPAAGLDVSTLREAMQLIGDRKVETEASGNVTLDTVRCACCWLGCAWLGCACLGHPSQAMGPEASCTPSCCRASHPIAPPHEHPVPLKLPTLLCPPFNLCTRAQGDGRDGGAVHLVRRPHAQRDRPGHLPQHRDAVRGVLLRHMEDPSTSRRSEGGGCCDGGRRPAAAASGAVLRALRALASRGPAGVTSLAVLTCACCLCNSNCELDGNVGWRAPPTIGGPLTRGSNRFGPQ